MTLTRDALRMTLAAACTAALLTGCGGGGDINISADDNSTSTDNSTTTSGGDSSSNPCASYESPAGSGTFVRGQFDGTNCSYSSAFVGVDNPLTQDVTIPFISGVHIFEDSLVVGENVELPDSSNPAPAGGTGPTLTIRAGATLAWSNADQALVVNRGSSINAVGSPTAPITLTGFSDAVTGTAGPEDVQLWGGVVINGNGITNKCSDAERTAQTCSILSEGKPSNYGGNDNAESSGTMRYVVIKHPGFEVAPGDELNGLTLNAVGSGTTMEFIQVYSTFDDGVEFFGGAVVVNNLVALYVKDDSIDYADGWVGEVNNALVIHSRTDGNRCIEADNQGSDFAATPTTSPTIRNLTCIISGNDGGTHGDSEGILLRRGVQSQIINSIVYDGYARTVITNSGNECLELDDAETRAFAADNTSSIRSTLLACEEPAKDDLGNGDSVQQWVENNGATAYARNTNNVVFTATDSGNHQVFANNAAGDRWFFSVPGATADTTQFTDDASATVEIAADADGDNFSGAVTAGDDWTANWTFGLDGASGDYPLWFTL